MVSYCGVVRGGGADIGGVQKWPFYGHKIGINKQILIKSMID